MEQKTNLTFGQALEALKAGKKVSRVGWNGKDMWIALTTGSEIPLYEARSGAVKVRAEELNTSTNMVMQIKILPHIDMKSATGEMVIGWLASQTDMLAEDWCVLD
jgi:putative NADPH-quinone reductase